MKRSKHPLSHEVLATFDMGELVPVGLIEVMPGDSLRMQTSALIRLSPLMTPVMHRVQVRIHHWFVPYRLVWDGWEKFITGGEDGEGDGVGGPPTFAASSIVAGQLGDYFGIPPGGGGSTAISQLPFRAYNKIWNENYRDQDLQDEVDETNISVLRCAWEKDYVTAARPWTQKGPAISVPLGGVAPVVPSGTGIPLFNIPSGGGLQTLQSTVGSNAKWSGSSVTANINAEWSDPKLEADLAAATGVPVNDFRLALAIQRYQEARAQYGSRFNEYLRYLGVRSSDARLQRPEYLGGGKASVAFSEVLRTGNSDGAIDDAPIGEMSGHGLSALRTRRWVRFFEEHGVVIALASLRPKTMYANGLHRMWGKQVKEEYWQKELEHVGQQEVYNKEVRINHATPEGVFGYQDRYAEYRHQESYVAGDFRTTLNDWHLGRIFASDPALNASFVECNPSKRIFAEQSADALWCMFSHSIQARRLLGHRTIGRIF